MEEEESAQNQENERNTVTARVDLTTEQKEKVILGVSRGFSDTRIAAETGLTQYLVRTYRVKVLNVSAEEVTEKKHRQWKKQIQDGVDIEVVAERYGVRAVSIKQILYRVYPDFSLAAIRKKHQESDKLRNKTGFDDPW